MTEPEPSPPASASRDARGLRGRWSPRRRFVIAALLVGLTVLLRLALEPLVGDRVQYVVLVLPVAISAWALGYWQGVFAAVLSALAALTLLVPPLAVANLPTPADLLSTGVYLAVALGVVAVADRAHRRGDELATRNAELQRLLDENRTLLAVREGFSSMLSHELRTPLTVILGQARLLAGRARGGGDPQTAEMLDDLSLEAERLARLVEDILVVNRPGSMRVELEPVLVQRTLPGVIAATERRYPSLQVHARLPADLAAVAADQTLLEQVLANLLSNAAKYAGPSSTVIVSCRAGPGRVTLTISDDGPGFPKEALGRAFDIFYRGPGAAGQAPGAGVGLYVVRRLVEAMGGEVQAANAPTGGATVTVTLRQAEVDADELDDSIDATA